MQYLLFPCTPASGSVADSMAIMCPTEVISVMSSGGIVLKIGGVFVVCNTIHCNLHHRSGCLMRPVCLICYCSTICVRGLVE